MRKLKLATIAVVLAVVGFRCMVVYASHRWPAVRMQIELQEVHPEKEKPRDYMGSWGFCFEGGDCLYPDEAVHI